MSDVQTITYVILRKGANARVRALADLAGRNSDLVFVLSGDPARAPGRTLLIKPQRNPLGIVRQMGLRKTARFLDSVVYVHNRHQLYVRRVVDRLRRLIGQDLASGRRVNVLTCVPPHALCLIGKRLKETFPDVRWIMDWQDLWSSDETYFRRVFRPYRPLVRRLEREVVRGCDVNLTTNDSARRWLLEEFGVPEDRVKTIGHHTDSRGSKLPVWSPCVERLRNAPRLVFMGRLFKGVKVPGGTLLRAIKAVRETTGIRPELHLYGRQGPEFEEYSGREEEFGLKWHGVIDQSQVVCELRKYDYLLLVLGDLPNSRLIMHMKLSEYLVAGPPILAVVPSDSAVADIVRRTGTGIVVPAEKNWTDGLSVALTEGADRLPTRDPVEIDRFSWPCVSGQWKSVLQVAQ